MAHSHSGQIHSSFFGHRRRRRAENRTRMAGEQLGDYLDGTGQQVFRGFSPGTLFGDYTPTLPDAEPGMINIGAAEQTLL